jgi:CheY-like chemotaxis protein
VASNGLEALEKIRKVSKTDGTSSGQPFDCVIMDLEMPGMSSTKRGNQADKQ